MIEVLANFLRSVILLSPNDLVACVYLSLNQLAPAYEGMELGIAETTLMKVIGQTTGRTMAQIKADAQSTGDLGIVAERSKSNQRMMFTPPPLTVEGVFTKLKEIAKMSGNAVSGIFLATFQSHKICFARFRNHNFIISGNDQETRQNSIDFCGLSSFGSSVFHAIIAGQTSHRFGRTIVVAGASASLCPHSTESICRRRYISTKNHSRQTEQRENRRNCSDRENHILVSENESEITAQTY